MDVATLEHELELLPVSAQDRLAAFLTALRFRREGIEMEFQDRLNDSSPENWNNWKQVKTDLKS